MADEWRITTIREVAAASKNALVGGPFGSDLVSTDYVPSGVPVIRGQNLSDSHFVDGEFVFVTEEKAQRLAANTARPGDLVFTQRGNAVLHGGQVAIVPDHPYSRYVVSQSQMKLTIDQTKVDGRFLYYVFKGSHHAEYLRQNAISTGVPHTNLRILGDYRFALPPLCEQEAIAHTLWALDGKIGLNRQRNRTLEAMARAIFQSWFVDFDPVKAKAAGRTPAGLSPEVAALFPDRFEDSPLGPIPAGWRVGTVGDVTDINGWTLGKRDELGFIDYIEISEVMRGEIATIARYPRGSEPGRARRRLRHGDSVISTVRPDRGSYFLCLDPSPTLLASTGFAVLTAKSGSWAFVHVHVTRDEFGDELGRLADGGAYPSVRPEVIAARHVIIPSESALLTAFERVVQPLLLHAESSRKESRILAAIRDALLPRLISGELRVPDAERIVGRAT